MGDIDIKDIQAGIDRHLPYLHKERWAIRAAELRDVVRKSEGEAKIAAEQALLDHYDERDKPETSRAPLLESAIRNITARQQG